MVATQRRSIAAVLSALVFISACSSAIDVGEVGDNQPPSTVIEATVAAPESVLPTAVPEPIAVLPTAAPPTAAPEATAVPPTPAPPTAVPEATAVPPAPAPPSAVPEATAVPPTAVPEATAVPVRAAVADADHDGLAGIRGLTLQWISWEPDDWGIIEFVPLVDGSYAVSGEQQGLDGDYVTVEGSLVRIDDHQLLFTGDVTVRVGFNNDGQPCVRSGDITFLATGERRFWRMQDLLSCDGIVTDYVDIYFG